MTTTTALTQRQISHLNLLAETCEHATGNQSYIRQCRLDKYMDKLMEQGISAQSILNAMR